MNRNYEYKKEIKNIRWLLFGVMLSLFASEVLFQAAASFMSNPPHNYVRMAIVETAAFVIPFILYGRMVAKKLNTKKELHLNALPMKKAIYTVLLGITGQFVIILLNFPLEYLYQTFLVKKEAAMPEALSPAMFFLAVVAAGIIPAFFEELLMRGMVFRAYNRVSTKAAVLFTTFIFVVFHGKPEYILGYAFMGYMAVFVMRRTDSLYAAMLYHFSSNVAAIVFSMVALKFVSILWALVVIMAALFIIIFIFFYVKYSPEKSTSSRSDTKLFLSSILSVPVLLSIGIVVLKYWLLNLR